MEAAGVICAPNVRCATSQTPLDYQLDISGAKNVFLNAVEVSSAICCQALVGDSDQDPYFELHPESAALFVLKNLSASRSPQAPGVECLINASICIDNQIHTPYVPRPSMLSYLLSQL